LSEEALQQRKVRGESPSGLALAAAVAWCRIQSLAARAAVGHAFLRRLLDSGERLTGALFCEALRIDEKSRLTVCIYDFYPDYKRVDASLNSWEEAWFEKRMPRPPARILVGACGSGREAVALVERGYAVDALEPAPEFAPQARRRLGPATRVMQLTYEQLSAAVLTGGAGAAEELRAARYDAVLLGYGSLAHVLDVREQRRLLRALDLLCPAGPILATFLCGADSSEPARTGRAERLGGRIGRGLARLRRLPPGGSNRLSYRPRRGFAYTFTRREIEELAGTVGRPVAWECGTVQPSHCATFLPGAAPVNRA